MWKTAWLMRPKRITSDRSAKIPAPRPPRDPLRRTEMAPRSVPFYLVARAPDRIAHSAHCPPRPPAHLETLIA
jgi:hypothetical protein